MAILAGCGSSHSASPKAAAAAPAPQAATPAPQAAAPAPQAAPSVATPAKPKAAKPKPGALKQACGYFPGDYQALTGELKMSDLTGAQLTEAARDVAEDLDAIKPALSAPQQAQLSQAGTVLASAQAAPRSQAVPAREKNALSASFQSPPFSTLTATLKPTCLRALK